MHKNLTRGHIKNVFLVFSGHFQSDLFPKGSKVILGYAIVISGFLLLESIHKEVSGRFSHILGHFRVKFANNYPK